MIVWREKLVAFAIHFLLTLLVAAAAAVLIFRVWFPDPFQSISGGTHLFLLIVGCDLALGPLLSLVIYNGRKSRRELVIDYAFVAIIQLAGIVYGIYSIAHWRPAYIVYAVDRLEVVGAGDLSPADVKAAPAPYDSLPMWGPKLVSVRLPENPAARNKAVMDAIGGKDLPLVPSYYAPYASQIAEIRAHAKRAEELEHRHPDARAQIEAAIESTGLSREQLLWLPVKGRMQFWTALIDARNGRPKAYIPLDPT
jgi:hypothetical protein